MGQRSSHSGDTRAELVAFVDGAVRILRSTLMGRVMQGLVSDLASNADLARAFREWVVAVRVAEIRRLVEAGIARGDLRADADFELANELLFGPVYYRLLLSGAPLADDLAERVVGAGLAGVRGACRTRAGGLIVAQSPLQGEVSPGIGAERPHT